MLSLSLAIAPDAADNVDVEAVFVLLRRFPSHVVMTWVQSTANEWCTTRRMHEQIAHTCLFGSRDSVVFYLQCSVLQGIALDALGCASPSSANTLSALGVHQVSFTPRYVLYVSFTTDDEWKS